MEFVNRCLFVSGLSLVSTCSFAADYFVSPTGSDSNTGSSSEAPLLSIQRAIDMAKAGDTIHLGFGTYDQDVVTKRSGDAGKPITIEGPATAVVRGTKQRRIFDINHSYVQLRGFSVDGLHGNPKSKGNYSENLISVGKGQAVKGVVLSGLNLRNAGRQCVTVSERAQNSTISDSVIAECGIYGYAFGKGNGDGDGISIGSGAMSLAQQRVSQIQDIKGKNKISNNYIDTRGGPCVAINPGSAENTVEYNVCTGQQPGSNAAFRVLGSRNSVRYNEIQGNHGAGVQLGTGRGGSGAYNDIYENLIHDNGGAGIQANQGKQGRVCGNDLHDNAGGAIVGSGARSLNPSMDCTLAGAATPTPPAGSGSSGGSGSSSGSGSTGSGGTSVTPTPAPSSGGSSTGSGSSSSSGSTGGTSGSTGSGSSSTNTGSATGSGSTGSSGGSTSTGSTTAGPRKLPPTFVQLEVSSFPRPAAEACSDNSKSISVAKSESIQAALDRAEPGTTVWVEPGTYSEKGDGSTSLTWDKDNICLRAKNGGTVVLKPGSSAVKYGISPSGDDTVIEGFTLQGYESGIAMWTQSGSTQHRVTIERVRVENLVGGFREGILAYGDNRSQRGSPNTVDGLLLLDVKVEGADLAVSCNAGPCAHWWLENTTINNRSAGGDSGADAFAIEEGRQIVVVNSLISGATADGIDTKATDVVVYGTQVRDVERNGIKLWHGGDVINSVVDGTGADASLVGDQAGHYRYLHTLIANHGAPGDSQYTATWGYDTASKDFNIEIVNCIFYKDATGGLYANNGAKVSMRNTLFQKNGKLFDFGKGGKTYDTSDLAAFESAGYGKNNSLADPLLTKISSYDYSTANGSPARDNAEAVDGLTKDLLGGPRVKGTGPDIGPVESP